MPLTAVGASLINTGANLAAPVLGLAYNSIFHRQQVRHQQDFINQQMEAQRSLGLFNKQNSLDLWNKTNYEAQRKHMEKAGLNVGLMYGGAGQGGQTLGASAGNVSGGNAPNAGQLSGMALQQIAQIKLLNAQADNLEADTENKRSDTNVNQAEVPNIQTDTELKQAQVKLTKFNTDIAEINADLAKIGKSLNIGMLNEKYNNLVANTKLTEAQTDEARERIINIGIHSALMQSEIEKNESDIKVNEERVKEIANKIRQEWDQIVINRGNMEANQDMAKARASEVFSNQIKQQFDMDMWVGDKLTQIGSMLFGGLMLKGSMTPAEKPRPAYNPDKSTQTY